MRVGAPTLVHHADHGAQSAGFHDGDVPFKYGDGCDGMASRHPHGHAVRPLVALLPRLEMRRGLVAG